MDIYWSVFKIDMPDSEYHGKWGAVSLLYNPDKTGAVIVGDYNDVKYVNTREEGELYCTQILKPYYNAVDTKFNLIYVEPWSETFLDLYDKWESMFDFLTEVCAFADKYHKSNWFVQRYMDLQMKIKGWFAPTP